MPIEIVTLCGSVRPGNFTAKALALVVDELRQQKDVRVTEIDLANVELALPGRSVADPAALEAFQNQVRQATGVILATPEYHGSFSSVIKLAIENMGFPSGLAGKPVALLGVAAGRIGAIKSLEHLRSVCSHVGSLVLPNLVSVANVQTLFDQDGRCLDPATEKLVRGVGTSLVHYIEGSVCPRFVLEAMLRESAVA